MSLNIYDNHKVSMLRDSLDDIPQFVVPDGFSICRYQAGDEIAWRDIHSDGDDLMVYSHTLFKEQFGSDVELLQSRQLYLCDGEDKPIGTASAWFKDYNGLEYGMVHWVAMLKDMQGQGLAKPLLTAVLNRMQELGHVRAYLDSGSARIPALNLYLNYGFKPIIASDDDKHLWDAIRAEIRNRKR